MAPRSEGETDASRALKSALLRMHAATVLFGLSGIFGKLCACTPAILVCGRAFFAVGALSLLCLARRHAPWQGLRCQELAGLALSGTLLTVHFVIFFMGIQLGGVAVGTLGFACFPAFTTLFEALAYREKPSGREYACMFFPGRRHYRRSGLGRAFRRGLRPGGYRQPPYSHQYVRHPGLLVAESGHYRLPAALYRRTVFVRFRSGLALDRLPRADLHGSGLQPVRQQSGRAQSPTGGRNHQLTILSWKIRKSVWIFLIPGTAKRQPHWTAFQKLSCVDVVKTYPACRKASPAFVGTATRRRAGPPGRKSRANGPGDSLRCARRVP